MSKALTPYLVVALCLSILMASHLFAGTLIPNGYDVLVFENHTVDSGDVEGRLAVGGDFISSAGTYSIADKIPGPGSADDVVFLVGGDVGPFSRAFHGRAIFGGSQTGSGSADFGVFADQGIGVVNAFLDFPQTRAELEALSLRLSQQADANVTINPAAGIPEIIAGSGPVSYASITANQLDTWRNLGGVNVVNITSDKTMIINVSGTAINMNFLNTFVNSYSIAANFPLPGFLNIGDATIDDAPVNRVLWNFYEATSIELTGPQIFGSVLAPFADMLLNGGAIEGDGVMKSLDQTGGGEFHFNNGARIGTESGNNIYSFSGFLIPEPSSAILLGLAGLLGLRRRRVR